MATKLSCSSSLPWIWVIEALASFNEIDTSLLINLVKRTEGIPDNLGRNARELASLRALESLVFQKSNANNVAPVPGDKIELDPSEHCEDVISRILEEMSASDQKTVAPEMLKWDVGSFITKKRSQLTKGFLQRLKEVILDSADQLSASLKERSGLEFRNCSKDNVPVDAADCDGFNEGREVGGIDTQPAAPAGNLDTSTHGDANGLKEDQLATTVLAVKRSIDASTVYGIDDNGTEAILENSSDPCVKAAKKCKKDVVSPIQNAVPVLTLSQKDGVPTESCGQSQPDDQKGDVEGEPQVGAFKANCLKDGGSNSNQNELLPQKMSTDRMLQNNGFHSNICAELETSRGSSQPMVEQDARSHGSKSDHECNLPESLQNGEPSTRDKESVELNHRSDPVCNLPQDLPISTRDIENVEQNHESEFSLDTDEYHDERIDLASQKNDFLYSQCSQSEESLAFIDSLELKLCVKCNKGGSLLICSSNTCPLVIHESCLGYVPNFDSKGNFYCPFCAYSRAISEYLEEKKKASLSRKDLAAFISSGTKQRPKNSLPRSQRMKHNHSREDKNEQLCHDENRKNSLNEITEAVSAPVGTRVIRTKARQTLSPQPEASVPEQCLVDGQQPEKSPLRYHTSKQDPSREEEELCHNVCRSKKCLEKVEEAGTGPVIRNSMNSKVMQMHPPQLLVPHELVCQESSQIEDSSEDDDESDSRFCIQFRKPEKKYTFPLTPQFQRKKIKWTKIEEEKLKEGLLRFSNYPDRWKKILEFGRDVFHRGRTSVDLKDKWRNITKGRP